MTVITIFGGLLTINNLDLIEKNEPIVEAVYCEDCLSYEEFIEVIEILDEQAKLKKQIVDISSSRDIIDKLLEGREMTDREIILIEKAKK